MFEQREWYPHDDYTMTPLNKVLLNNVIRSNLNKKDLDFPRP
jgi:hypothetical protein